jgi:hypothetical protein
MNIRSDYGTAVPEGITSWTYLENWSDPTPHCYKISFKNLLGLEIVSFEVG